MEPSPLAIANSLAELVERMRTAQDELADDILDHVRVLADMVPPAAVASPPADAGQRDEIHALQTRCELLETHVNALRSQLSAAAGETETLRREIERLRTPIIRYAIACAAVDLQQALRKRLPTDTGYDDGIELTDALGEEKSASDSLRDLARRLQAPGSARGN
jgi:hypothetical protein